jgi:hypothetical protein
MKIRITITYDPDCPANVLEQDCLRLEQEDWHNGQITFEDIAALAADTPEDATITFEKI